MDATTFWVHQQMRRVDAAASSAQSQLSRARTMAEVVGLADVSVPGPLHALRHQIQGLKTLRLAVERRLEALLVEQLTALEPLSLEEAQKHVAGLQRREWQALRGEWASVYRKAEADARRCLAGKAKPA